MDPPAIAVALTQIEDGEDVMRSSVELFWGLFRNLTEDEEDKLRNELSVSPTWLQDIHERGNAITSGAITVLAVHDPATFAERLPKRLRELAERLTPLYVPDEPDDAEALFIAVHLQASRLAFYLIQSAAGRDDRLFNYGEDASLYTQPLEKLIAGLKASMPRRGSPREFPEVFQMSIMTIESLAERVGVALAARRGEYAEALARLVNSLTCAAFVGEINEAWEHSENPEELVDLAQACPWRTFSRMVDSGTWFAWTLPWLSEAELPTQQAAQWYGTLKSQPNRHDWRKLASTFDDLAEGFTGRADVEPEDVEVDGWSWDVYWYRAQSWAENQLTADELRERNEAIEDKRAEERLRKYFFTDAQWNVFPEGAKVALVSADRARVSSEYKAPVLDGLRIAMADILYHGLWIPIEEWAKAQTPENLRALKTIQERLVRRGHEPKLADYNQLLSAPEVKTHLQNRDVSDDDISFIIGKETKDWFNRLLKVRNSAVYKPNAKSGPGEVHTIYAEFMGLGRDRRAILPELVRILSQPSS